MKKTVLLFVIISATRKQALFTIRVENILFKDKKIVCLKRPLDPLMYYQYSENYKLCIVSSLNILLRYSKDDGQTRDERIFN